MESETQKRKSSQSIMAFAVIGLLLSFGSFFDLGWTLWIHFTRLPCRSEVLSRFFSLSSLAGVVFGLATFRMLMRKKIATLAMVFGAPSLLLTIFNFPSSFLLIDLQSGRETAAIQTLRTIYNNQAQFQAMKNCFGTLNDLANAGLIDDYHANGKAISGYRYGFSDVTTNTYCVYAYRVNPQCGGRDFIVCEDGEIRYVETATVRILKRGDGMPLVPHSDPVLGSTP